MLAGVLTVLKIIGIVLLVILAIVLLLVLLILFVPIRYKADVQVPETELDNGFNVETIRLKAGFSWLLHFISGGIDFPNNKQFTVKVLGITVFPRKKKEKKAGKKKADNINKKEAENIDNNTDKEKTSASDNTSDSVGTDSSEISYEEKSDMGEPENKGESAASEDADKKAEQNDSNCADNSENKTERKALIEIITDILEKIENILKTPQTVLEKIQYTTSRVCDKIGMIKTTLENDIFKRAFSLVKRKLIRIIRMVLPDKIRAKILLGTGDPADTAEILALYSAFYPKVYKKIQFEPDFDRKVVMADAHVKGHITCFTILYCAAVCYFNKDVKKTIKRFKKIINS